MPHEPTDLWRRLRGLKPDLQRHLLQALFREDPWLFLRLCLYPERSFEPFHREWLEQLYREPRSVLLAPRGFFKTTAATVGLLAQRAFFYPQGAWLVVSRTGRQARLILDELRRVLGREELAWLRGGRVIERDTVDCLWLACPERSRKEPVLAAAGAGQGLVGRHHDGVVADDLVSTANALSQRGRERLEAWFTNVLTPTLLPGAFLHLVGTRYHPLDLYGRLLARGVPNNKGSRAALGDDGAPLFPSRWPRERLEERRRELGPVSFALQYQNDVALASGTFFRPEWLRRPAGAAPPAVFRVLAADLALGGGDYFALVVLAVAADGDWYVEAALRARLDFHAQLELLERRARRHGARLVGIESVAYQSAAVQELRRRARLPVIALNPRGGKLLRANVLAAHLASGRLWLPVEVGPLTEELLAFPHGRHDDLVDALGYACELAAGRGHAAAPPRLDDQLNDIDDDPLARSLGLQG